MNTLKIFTSALMLLLLVGNTYAQTSYLLGVGDQVRITVYGQPELNAEGQINADGAMEIPLLGAVKVAGLSSGDAAKLVSSRFQSGNFLKSAQVDMLVTQYRSQVVAILGKVNRPGKLTLEGATSLTQALAWAGGVADAGSERLFLIRKDSSGRQERREYDLQKLLNREADNSPVVWLKDGDTLYIPVAGRFYVNGEVRAPGMYLLDRPLNVMQALGVGGGLNPRASERSVKLFRQQADGSVKELRAKSDDMVSDGDVIVVQESLF